MEGPSVEWIIQKINIQTTLTTWVRGIFGDLEDRTSSVHIVSTIERILNSMVMVGYGGLVSSNDSSPNFASQGCLVQLTHIPWQVTSLLLLVTIMSLAMVAIWCVVWLLLSKEKKKLDPSDGEVLEEWTPNGLIGWMDYAIWASKDSKSRAVQPKEIKNWKIGSRPFGLVMDGGGDEGRVDSLMPLMGTLQMKV